jgi:hypothetical protein
MLSYCVKMGLLLVDLRRAVDFFLASYTVENGSVGWLVTHQNVVLLSRNSNPASPQPRQFLVGLPPRIYFAEDCPLGVQKEQNILSNNLRSRENFY